MRSLGLNVELASKRIPPAAASTAEVAE